jgi:hypothetical protein
MVCPQTLKSHISSFSLREIGFIVYTSGVWLFEFLLRTIGFGFLKISDSGNCRLLNQNQRTIDSNYFQTLNEPAVCRKEA